MAASGPKGTDSTRDTGKVTPHPAVHRTDNGADAGTASGTASDPTPSYSARWTRRYWPLLAAGFLSLLWIGAVAAFFLSGPDMALPGTFSLPELGAIVSGGIMPLVLIWLFALVIMRTDLFREQRIAVAQGLDELLSPVDQAERRTTALTEKLRQQIENVESASEIAADRIKRLEDRFQAQITDLFSATTKAEETANAVVMRLRGEEQALSGLRTALETTVAGIETRLQEAGEALISNSDAAGAHVNRAQETLINEGRTLSDTLNGLKERLGEIETAMKQAVGGLETGLDHAEARAGEAAQSLLSREVHLREVVTALGDAARQTAVSMSDEGQKLADQRQKAIEDAETLEALSGRLRDALEEARNDAQAVAGTMSETVSELEDQLAKTRARTEDDSEAISALIRTRTEEAATALEARAEDLRNLLTDEQAAVGNALEDHARKVADALDEQARSVRAAVSQQNQTVHDSISEQRQHLTDALEDHLKRLQEELARHAAQAGDQLADADDRALSHLEAQAERLRDLLNEQGSAAEDLLERYGATFEERIGTALRQAEEALGRETTSIEEAARQAEIEITRLSDILRQGRQDLSRTGSDAAETTVLLGATLDEQLSGLNTTVSSIDRAIKDLTARTEQFGQAARKEGQGVFARTSALVIEALGSASIDINRALETEIPDNVWQRYLKGDRSIFARRTLRLGSRKAQKAIAEKFGNDAEFRTHVEEYLREFESLMGQAMAADPKNVLSATLVSSELGKLYVLLAQSLDRFK